MKYQISCSVHYDNFGLRNAALARMLNQYKLKAFLGVNNDGGDYIWPVKVGEDWVEGYEPPDGPYKLQCRFRMEMQEDRDEVFDYLTEQKNKIDLTIEGFIEKHDCYHEDNYPCTNKIIDKWP